MLKIGVAEINITPEPGYPLGGYAERYMAKNRAIGKLNDIYARALYLGAEDNELLIVSAEILAFENDFADALRSKLSAELGIRKDNIILVATHTHSAPDVMLDMILFRDLLKKEDIELIARYREFLSEKILEVAKQAVQNSYETELYFGKTRAKNFCANRVNPNGVKDDEVLVLTDEKKWVLINLTCHPTVLGASNLMYSGDFLSYATSTIKRKLGDIITLYSIGAAGDQSTRFIRRNQTPGEAERIGNIVADSVIEGLRNATRINSSEISSRVIRAILPSKKISDMREELIRKINEWEIKLNESKDTGYQRRIRQNIETARILLSNYEKFAKYLRNYPEEIPVNIGLFRIGNIKLVFLPLELSCQYAIDIKKVEKTWIITYSNGYYGYLPTEREYDELDYEAMMSPFEKGSGRILVSEIIKSL